MDWLTYDIQIPMRIAHLNELGEIKKDSTDFNAICPNYKKISSVGFYTSPQ